MFTVVLHCGMTYGKVCIAEDGFKKLDYLGGGSRNKFKWNFKLQRIASKSQRKCNVVNEDKWINMIAWSFKNQNSLLCKLGSRTLYRKRQCMFKWEYFEVFTLGSCFFPCCLLVRRKDCLKQACENIWCYRSRNTCWPKPKDQVIRKQRHSGTAFVFPSAHLHIPELYYNL